MIGSEFNTAIQGEVRCSRQVFSSEHEILVDRSRAVTFTVFPLSQTLIASSFVCLRRFLTFPQSGHSFERIEKHRMSLSALLSAKTVDEGLDDIFKSSVRADISDRLK